MLRYTLLSLLLLMLTSTLSNAQELAMDIRVVAGGAPGVVDIELFSSNPQTATIEIRFRSDVDERVVTATNLQTSISGLTTGMPYVVSAIGLSATGVATETTPEESIVAP